MKRNLFCFSVICVLLTSTTSGCESQKTIFLVNTLTFKIGDFQSLRLDYDADDIYVLESDNDKVILKEYMNEDEKSYYARTTTQNGELLITEGKRPRRSSFESYIEIYIPQDYTASLSLHSTSGTIESGIALNLSGVFSVDTTSGTIKVLNTKVSNIKITSTNGNLSFENIGADAIDIRTTNATISINQVSGVISYQSKDGKLTASNISGSGSFNASGDGSMDVSFADVTGYVSAYSKNGTLTFELPSLLEFNFAATTKEGSIDTSFDDQIIATGGNAAGIVGSSPNVSIQLETRNGDIKVSR